MSLFHGRGCDFSCVYVLSSRWLLSLSSPHKQDVSLLVVHKQQSNSEGILGQVRLLPCWIGPLHLLDLNRPQTITLVTCQQNGAALSLTSAIVNKILQFKCDSTPVIWTQNSNFRKSQPTPRNLVGIPPMLNTDVNLKRRLGQILRHGTLLGILQNWISWWGFNIRSVSRFLSRPEILLPLRKLSGTRVCVEVSFLGRARL